MANEAASHAAGQSRDHPGVSAIRITGPLRLRRKPQLNLGSLPLPYPNLE
jgi:hypothetical protein